SIELSDGRQLQMTYSGGRNDRVVFLGEYEPLLTQVCSDLIQSGDICVDAGANFGWYTTLFARLVGPAGEVHAFEPVAAAFEELERNVRLVPNNQHIRLNKAALGDRDADIEINVFPSMGLGYSSIADRGRSDAVACPCRMVMLDTYWGYHVCREISFLKGDVEGAELLVLKGSTSILNQKRPPILFMEMSANLTANFGYTPMDFLSFVSERGAYEFFAADEVNNSIRKLDRSHKERVEANIFCIPSSMAGERRQRLNKYIK
ncbi:MAG: FkbM family methyltransferase, partial [bacterium]|nr:FkbM family methyltransferase [bacterium]